MVSIKQYGFELAFVPIEQIYVDEQYQRQLDSARVKKISAVFRSGAMKAVSLSRRPDGSLWCYDGQHTLHAAARAGWSCVPAVIVAGEPKQEADWFGVINESSKRVSARQRHIAGVVAENESAMVVSAILARYRIDISTGGLRQGRTNALAAIGRYAKQDYGRLIEAMNAIDCLWRDEKEAWGGTVLRGMFEACGKYAAADLIRACRRKGVTPRRIMDWCSARQTAAGSGGGGGNGYACEASAALSGV